MPIKKKQLTLTDGILGIYAKVNGKLTLIDKAYYEKRTVGIKRFEMAQEIGSRADKLVRIPYRDDVNTSTVIELPYLNGKGTKYEIIQTQEILDVMPPKLALTLREGLGGKYKGIE